MILIVSLKARSYSLAMLLAFAEYQKTLLCAFLDTAYADWYAQCPPPPVTASIRQTEHAHVHIVKAESTHVDERGGS